MKPIHLNLASKPYRDDRPFYTGVAAVVVLTLLLTLMNARAALDYLENTRTTRDEITKLERSIALERQRAQLVESKTKSVDLKRLNKQTTFINSQIAERAFSWSNLLTELERVTPNDVRLQQLNPTVDKSGVTKLNLDCMAKSQDGMVKMLRGLLSNPHFSGAFPDAEQANPDGTYRFTVEVQYLPASGVLQ